MLTHRKVIGFIFLLLCPLFVYATHDDHIIVIEQRQSAENIMQVPHTSGGDAAVFMQWVPGGGINTNGQLSAQPQYRGLFGPRVNVHIDQAPFEVSPNLMDPPLHYAPKTLLKSVHIHRGIAPVSSGSGIGGHISADLLQSEFITGDAFESHGKVELLGHSVDEGYNGGFLFGLSNRKHRVHVFGSRDDGDDTKAGDGDISYTEYERDAYGFGYGFRTAGHEIAINYKGINTGDTGTPALPMDIDYFHSDFGQLSYKTYWNDMDIGVKVYHNDVEHEMSNYHLRPAPAFSVVPRMPMPDDGDDKRRGHVRNDGVGFAADIARPFAGGNLKMGVDGYNSDHEMDVSDPDAPPFFVKNINNAESDRLGAFIEWNGAISKRWHMEAGLRYQSVGMSADTVDALPARLADRGTSNPVTEGARLLRNTFNNTDRRKNDDNIDAVLQFSYGYNDYLTFLFAAARKTRSPNYVERYIWMPLEINSGLGDGNNYVGNPDLEPEFSHELELGADWRYGQWYVSPRIYHRRVNNYIQGTDVDCNDGGYGEAVCNVSGLANGDVSPKQFTNVDANIYGADMEFAYQFNQHWRLDGIASYVRGRRHDSSDNLFRIAPHKLQFSLKRYLDRGSIAFETIMVDEQDKLAKSLLDADNLKGNIDTEPTPGYILFNLRGQYHWPGQDNLILSAGVENILDKHYRDHLAAFNRAKGSDVAVGERLPGAGRNIFLNAVYKW